MFHRFRALLAFWIYVSSCLITLHHLLRSRFFVFLRDGLTHRIWYDASLGIQKYWGSNGSKNLTIWVTFRREKDATRVMDFFRVRNKFLPPLSRNKKAVHGGEELPQWIAAFGVGHPGRRMPRAYKIPRDLMDLLDDERLDRKQSASRSREIDGYEVGKRDRSQSPSSQRDLVSKAYDQRRKAKQGGKRIEFWKARIVSPPFQLDIRQTLTKMTLLKSYIRQLMHHIASITLRHALENIYRTPSWLLALLEAGKLYQTLKLNRFRFL